MSKKIQACLLLQCSGYTNKCFVHCAGISNPIIDLEKINDDNYDTIIDFFDSACNLFNCPVTDYNACSNILNLLHKTYNAYDVTTLNNIQLFIKNHKYCKISLSLVLKENLYGRK